MGQCSCKTSKTFKKEKAKIEKKKQPDIISLPPEQTKAQSFMSTNSTCNDYHKDPSLLKARGSFYKKIKSAEEYLKQIGVSLTNPDQKRFQYYFEKEELPQQSDLNMQAFSQQLFPSENNFNEIQIPNKFGYNQETFLYFTQPLKCTSILKSDTIKLKVLSDQLMLQLFEEEMGLKKREIKSLTELQRNLN